MTDVEIERTRAELIKAYPGCRVKVAEDKREMVAEITDEFAVKKGPWLDVASQGTQLAGGYGQFKTHQDAYKLFAQSVEDLIRHEIKDYIWRSVRSRKRIALCPEGVRHGRRSKAEQRKSEARAA